MKHLDKCAQLVYIEYVDKEPAKDGGYPDTLSKEHSQRRSYCFRRSAQDGSASASIGLEPMEDCVDIIERDSQTGLKLFFACAPVLLGFTASYTTGPRDIALRLSLGRNGWEIIKLGGETTGRSESMSALGCCVQTPSKTLIQSVR